MTVEPMSYIALADCGCLMGATVDSPNRKSSTARYVGGWIKQGFQIKEVDTQTVRTMPWQCETHAAETAARKAAGDNQTALL